VEHPPGYYDFRGDRAIATEILEQVRMQAEVLSSDADGEFMGDFTKSFRTMSQDRRAVWLREAALAANAAESEEAATRRAAEAAKQKSSAEETAMRIAADVSEIVYDVARKKTRASPGPYRGLLPPALAAAPLGLVAGGAVAYAIRRRRKAQQKARQVATDVQVRRERQATQAVVTTCAYVLAALDAE